MRRDQEFTFPLDDGTYVVKLFDGVVTERSGDTTTGRWPAFDLSAEGDSDEDVFDALLSALRERIGVDQAAPAYRPLLDYVRDHGTRLTAEEVAEREVENCRNVRLRWRFTEDEQYLVPFFRDVEVERSDGTVTVRAFGLEGSGPKLTIALQVLKKAIDGVCGTQDAPGPRHDEITAWVRAHGEPVGEDVLAKEAADKAAYVVARDKLTPITPEDIVAESSTGIPLLVDFWAEWCGPCRMVTPVLAELAESWAGRIVVRKINVDDFEGLWERFGFRGIPAMLLFKDGEEIHRVLGFGGKRKLLAELEAHVPASGAL